ncbi:MAG: hypothetical protein HYV07_28970 [Deltaproteobacteria bacterium]|nr:hypothetical protein [Deltaproteobacteria bacterium]
MGALEAIVDAARAEGVRPWIAVKEGLAEHAIGELARAGGVVASASRFARRGTLKTTDVYDLWFLQARLGVAAPSAELVARKAADYAEPPHHDDLGGAVLAIGPEELRAALDGVLPRAQLDGLDIEAVRAAAAELLRGFRDVV